MGRAATRDQALLEREDEIALLADLVDAVVRGEGRCACVEGPPGIGKSALLGAAAGLAAERGVAALSARAAELERDFPYGVVRQLFDAALAERSGGERARLLSGAAALAAPALGVGSAADVDAASAAPRGIYWLTAALAAGGPLLLAVDDAHWADAASLRCLVHLARRLEGLPVALLVAVRDGAEDRRSPPLAELLAAASRRSVVRPSALSGAAVGRLLARSAGAVPGPEVVGAVREATGGNPFLVRELAGALAADGIPLERDAAGRIRELVPRSVSRSIGARLAPLPPAAAAVVEAVAVLGERAEVRHVAALAAVADAEVLAAAGALVRAGLLRDGLPLGFAHPLLRSTVLADMVAVERAARHARAAELLAASGAEPDAVAGHLLAAAPAGRPQVVEALRAAAGTALARGAAETAVAYLRRALEEPPEAAERLAVLSDLGRAEALTQDPATIGHLEEARALARGPVERARCTYALASVLLYVGRWGPVLDVVGEAIEDLGDRDDALRLRLWALRVALMHHPSAADDFEVQLPELLELARSGRPEARALRLYLALLLSVRGVECSRVPGLVADGLDGGGLLRDEGSESFAAANAVHALVHVDRLHEARAAAEALLGDARARGSALGFVNGIGTRALAFLRAGALADAEADARVAVDLTREHRVFLVEPYVTAYLAGVLLETGGLDEAATLVEEIAIPEGFTTMPGWPTLLEARARVRLARGDAAGAVAAWREAGALWAACRVRNPDVTAWRSELAVALGAEEPAEARALVDAELDDARRAGSDRAVGVALRARGLLAGGEDGLQDLAAAAATLESTPAALEHARTLTELGAALRRANRRLDAREPLLRAREAAHRCGATVLRERADAEVRATGARPRRLAVTGSDALTASERRVAALAASGLGNREIGQELFVTVNTVESHLRHAYRKLGIHSREELAAALGGTGGSEPPGSGGPAGQKFTGRP